MRTSASSWEAATFFVLRTPYFPVETLLALGEGLEASPLDPEANERDRNVVRQRLRDLWRRADVQEAIHLASPGLARSLDSDPGRRAGAELSLLRYLSRMAGRPTPFGLFAGWSLGETANLVRTREVEVPTHIELLAQQRYRRHNTLDCGYLGDLAASLKSTQEVVQLLTYCPNPTLYEAAGRLRYVESSGDNYRLVFIEPDPILRHVLTQAAEGRNRADLAAGISAAFSDIGNNEACSFIDDLIAQQVLVSGLGPGVTGADPLDGLLRPLAEMPPHPARDTLELVRGLIKDLDSEPPGVDLKRYEEVAKALETLPAAIDPAHLIHTDLIKPAHAVLGADVIDEVRRGADLLRRISGANPSDPLANFRRDFRRRYGSKDVPLAEALDEEAGVGFSASPAARRGAGAAPALAGLNFPAAKGVANAEFGTRDELLYRWISDALHSDDPVIVLGPGEIAELEATRGAVNLPDSFSVMATLLARDAAAANSGRFRLHLAGLGGASGANLLGRFCAGDEALTEQVRGYLKAEEALQPEAIFAEIVHLPVARLGNILARPALRDHEIPYLGAASVPVNQQIPVADLLVGLLGDRVVLRSRRLGVEIIPRLTAAHNVGGARNLGVYRFLCAMQNQGTVSGLAFSYGALDTLPFLPRVTAGKLILSRARWNLTAADIAAVCHPDPRQRFDAVQEVRLRLRLPRWVGLVEHDRILPLDLESVLFVDAAVEHLKGSARATLVEQFFGSDEVLVTGPEGHFVHELIVPFLRNPGPLVARHTATNPLTEDQPGTRRFPPGSEWLYAKIYTGAAGMDQVLREVVRPVIDQSQQRGAVGNWFFVRHGDPDWHLRLRVHGDGVQLLDDFLPALLAACDPHLASGLIWRLQLDTYEREVERYGGPAGIDVVEGIFGADSGAVLKIIETLGTESSADDRWRLALLGVHALLTDLGLDCGARLALADQARRRFEQEFNVDTGFRRQLGEKFRQERVSLERILENPASGPFSERSEALKPLVLELRHTLGSAELLEQIAGSLLHMHVNRLLRSAARAQELVIYDVLARIYRSELARQNATQQ